jgi:hypothetical protein
MTVRLKRDRFGQSAERGRHLLDQLELQLEELEASAAEDQAAAAMAGLADVLGRIKDQPASRLAGLLPWNWRKPPEQAAA